MKRKILITSAVLLIPIVLFSQEQPPNSEDIEKAVQFLQGGNIIEDWFMKAFLVDYRKVVMSKWTAFTDIARAIGGVAALVFFAQKSYEMMTGGKMQIMPLLRPFGLLFIILFWTEFISIVEAPMNLIANKASTQYHESTLGINELRIKRAFLQKSAIEHLFEEAAKNEIAVESGKKTFMDNLKDMATGAVKKGFDLVVHPMIKFKLKMQIGLQMIFTQLVELLALWILRICVYAIFLIQIIYSGVLIMLGPIAVAFSIFPMFRDSFATWLARFISVQFYVVVAFIILTVCNTIQDFALTAEIGRYQEMVTETGALADRDKLFFLASNGLISFGMVIVSFLISGIAILTTPTVSTWIVTSTGLGGAVNTLSRGAKAAATGGKSIVMGK